MQPIDYAKAACTTMMRRFAAPDLPPAGHFHYHQGVFLSGVLGTWRATGDDAYLRYVKEWVDSVIGPDGSILKYDHGDLDDIQPGILLFTLADQFGDERYARAIEQVFQQVVDCPRTAEGGLFHKVRLTNQMWLDGLYMSGPFCAEYARRNHRDDVAADVVHEARLMFDKTLDPGTGLLRHAWDGSEPGSKARWADPVTGQSAEFWGRAIGWVPVALLDDLDHLDPADPRYAELLTLALDLLKALCRFQSPEGRWYQVIDKGDVAGNWLENSCTSLFVAALAKAVRLGHLDPSYADAAQRGYEAVIASLGREGEDLLIGDVCIGTGVGDYDFYIARPTSTNDLHGVGAFLLMCTQMHLLNQSRASS